ncbi:MAG TPA: Gfo/Idh/MocA family oxidoreductase [Cyclobacteriaceae bacterium]|nr:Gfo/Idh/MocA family oxidoreductase [Cyclobacteriaceae bacterium]
MSEQQDKKGFSRRDLLKGLVGIPVVGSLFAAAAARYSTDQEVRETILSELNINAVAPPASGPMSGDAIRLGIIGFGIRGKQLMRALGFADKGWKESMLASAQKNSNDSRLKDFLDQENLNVQIRGVCDVFDTYAQMAVETGTVEGNTPKRYRTFQEMVQASDIDAIVIAAPDHWHAPMAMEAARAGKHVYVEKPMTHNLSETYELYNTIKETGVVFQVGHQHRQTQSFLTAIDAINKGVLGHISLIQTNTNRNDDNGAWQYDIHKEASPQTVDWNQFLGNAPSIPWNPEHFFRWRKWWEYGTGLSGDLLTHDYDRINCLLKMGIPKTVVASGGVYTHNDGRDVPDVFQVVMEYPDFYMTSSQEPGKVKGMTFMYSSTLGNQYDRGTILMGHDGTMELGNSMTIYADPRSTRYADWVKNGLVSEDVPLYSYNPQAKGLDGVTSATARYFADKGLLFTYRDGKRVDSTHLHMREWLSCIRNGGKPSCSIEEGFQEAIAAHMGTLSLKTGRRVEWDPTAKKIVDFETEEIDNILVSTGKIAV